MSKFTEADIGHHFTYRDSSVEWRLDRIKDGFAYWSTDGRTMHDARHKIHTDLKGYVVKVEGSIVAGKDKRVFTPIPENRFVTPDVGDTYLDLRTGRRWKLKKIDHDTCTWTSPVDNHPDDILYTTLSGWQTTVSGNSVLPIKRMFDPSEAPVEVSGDIRMVVDNESRIDMIKATDPMTGKTASITTISETPPAAALMQQRDAERSDTFEAPQEPLADAGDSGVKIEIGAVQSGKQAKAITEAGREALQELTDKGMDEAVVSKMVRVWENTMVGKYPPKLDLLPTQALAMVQQLLADPASLPVHEHLGVKAERYYLAHSVCAQLFRLERLIQEMD